MSKYYLLRYTKRAEKDLLECEKVTAKRILGKLADNIALTDPLQRAKKLSGILSGVYRYRIGDYRVLFEVTENDEVVILMVLNIKHRKDVYRI